MFAKTRCDQAACRSGITLIEVLVLGVIIVVLILLILPAIQSAREAARRARCLNNLHQLARATDHYVAANAVYPLGIRDHYDPVAKQFGPSESWVLMITPYTEYKYVYDSCNFNASVFSNVNSTVSGIGIPMLWCPSDPSVARRDVITRGTLEGDDLPMHHTSYGASAGEFFLLAPANLSRARMNGIIYASNAVSLAYITDGTSNTLLHGEWAHGKLFDGTNGIPDYQKGWHHWTSGKYGDTMFSTYFPINAFDKSFLLFNDDSDMARNLAARRPPGVETLSSFHAGGANVAMCDSSVRFVKDSVSSWTNNWRTGLPVGLTYIPYDPDSGEKSGMFIFAPGMKVGIYQQISTRNGGEVIPPGSY
jgi:prepilin-type processing-associated H-X9-DG protein